MFRILFTPLFALLLVLKIVLLMSESAVASDQGLYYRLHQATRLLEQYSRSACKKNDHKIREQLVSADAELGENIRDRLRSSKNARNASAFETDLQELWTLYKNRSSIMEFQLESFRYKIHQRAEELKLKHDEAWYKEADLCASEKI